MSRFEKMKEIKEEVVSCRKCPLHKERNLPVIGEGSHEAKIMFVGEGPGANEDKTGRPFCGRAGQVLNKLLSSIDLPRKEVYITNIVKCRPPGNRDPEAREIHSCTPYLERQIGVIRPRVISPLGRYAASFIMEKYGIGREMTGISKVRGQEFEVESSFGKLMIIPLYHPAVATYRATLMPELKNDFEVLKKYKG